MADKYRFERWKNTFLNLIFRLVVLAAVIYGIYWVITSGFVQNIWNLVIDAIE